MDYWTQSAAILKALNSENRLKTFVYLCGGDSPKHIAEELGVTRSALQHYIDDFKELGLIETKGKQYEVTDFGQNVLNKVQGLQKTIRYHQRQQKIEALVDAGLSREEIMQHLKKQGYETDEIISAISLAASDSNELGDPEGTQEDVLSINDAEPDQDSLKPNNLPEITVKSQTQFIPIKDHANSGNPVIINIDDQDIDSSIRNDLLNELKTLTDELNWETDKIGSGRFLLAPNPDIYKNHIQENTETKKDNL